ncbi:hypothetical protein K449DRAFT_468357 [Hypoxylon sp. EC38]|nr:hypothetical protein K449DRAFT_468357 [Hypoxylon sp. EC38]
MKIKFPMKLLLGHILIVLKIHRASSHSFLLLKRIQGPFTSDPIIVDAISNFGQLSLEGLIVTILKTNTAQPKSRASDMQSTSFMIISAVLF